MNISFFLIFYHLIRLLVKALQCELVIFQKEPFCGDSLVVEALMEKYQIIGKLRLTKPVSYTHLTLPTNRFVGSVRCV